MSRVIAASPQAVYAFAADPDNLPKWAAGLAQGAAVREGDRLLMDSPLGRIMVAFVPRNDFGIMDHAVTLPSGEVVNNPVRVIAHPEGAEIVFTIRQLDLSDDDFDRDAAAVGRDLDTLKILVEQGS